MTIMASIFGLDYTELDAPIFLPGSMAHFCEGAFYPQGGSGRLSRVLANQFRELSGDLHLKQHVKEILFENKHPVGVRIAVQKSNSMRTVGAACVIVGCDTNEMVMKLCSPGLLRDRYVKNILDRVPGPSAVLVWVGLDIDLREHGFTMYEVIRNHNAQHSAAELLNHVIHMGDYSILPFSGVTVYSNIDPTCCPPGKSVITSICIASEDVFEHALASDGAYKVLKERVQGQFMKHMLTDLMTNSTSCNYFDILQK
jgi:phytoene dehydrogenase-like protein